MATETWRPADLSIVGKYPGQFVEVKGTRLHYVDQGGSGIPVLFLHGINQNVRTWELVLPHVQGPWRIILTDHRGHGLSDGPNITYHHGDLVRDYIALIDSLKLDRPIIVGHSLGGWIGISIAEQYPKLLGGLVMGDISPYPGASMIGNRLERMKLALSPGKGDMTWAGAEEAFAFLKAANPWEEDSEVRARMRQQLRLNSDGRLERARSARIASAILEETAETDLWPQISRIEVPARVVWAEKSDVLDGETARRIAREIKQCDLVAVPDAHHDLQLCQPKLWGEAIEGFLQKHTT